MANKLNGVKLMADAIRKEEQALAQASTTPASNVIDATKQFTKKDPTPEPAKSEPTPAPVSTPTPAPEPTPAPAGDPTFVYTDTDSLKTK